MAFGIKYKAFFKDVDGLVKEIRLSKDGYSGSIIEWDTQQIGFEKDVADTDVLFGDNPIATTQLKLGFVFSQEYDLREFATSRRTFKCEIVTIVSGLTEFSGWIEPWDAAHPYMMPGYEVSMVASCGLGQLGSKRFKLPEGNVDDLKTGYEIIKICLDLTGIELPIRTSVHTYLPGTYPQDPLTTYTINVQRYIQGETRLTCSQVLETELNKFNAILGQWDNKWVVISRPDHALGVFTGYYEYSIDNAPSYSSSWGMIYPVNSDVSYSLDGGQIRLEPPINKYTAQADLLPKISIFSNSDLQSWNSSGLIGWDFSHMPQGNPGWNKVNTGDEDYPFALQVMGQGPAILKWHKKNWFSKKKLITVEPGVYLQSPTGTYAPTVKTVTIKFQYYTWRNGFIIAIRLSSSYDSSKVRWVKMDTSLSENWDAILIDKHLQTNTGSQKNVKGEFSIDIPLEFYNTMPRSGPEGATPYAPYDQITVRFYQSYRDNDFSGNPYYTIFNLDAQSESLFDNDSTTGAYTTTLSHENQTEEESSTIQLLTGDYTVGFSGTTLNVTTGLPTDKWFRRGNVEGISIYRAMMLDRLCMTWKPCRVFEGKIKVLPGKPSLTYLHTLQFDDLGGAKFMIVRYKYEEYRRIADVVAIEIDYEEPANLAQETFIGRNRVGSEDAVYPSSEGSGGGRLGVDQEPLTDDEIEDIADNGRLPALFEDIDPLTYTVAVESEDWVDLSDYFSTFYTESEADLDPEDQHDPEDFSISVMEKPSWITEISIDGLIVTVSALAPKSGMFYIFTEVLDSASGVKTEVAIPILVEESEEFIEAWPPVFDPPLPTLFFEVGKETTDGFLITDYMPEDLVYEHLSYRIMGKPEWVSDQSVVFGEVSVTGKPVKIETRYLTLEMTDAIGRIHVEEITLACIKKTVLKHNLLDTGIDGPATLGSVPGFYALPTKFDLESVVTGFHDRLERTLIGGGPSGTSVNETVPLSVTETNLGSYRMFPDTDGIAGPAGQYTYTLRSYRGTRLVTEDIIFFTLYDDEFLAKYSADLYDTTKDALLGVIDPSGSSKFKNVKTFDVKNVIADLEHDKITLILMKDGVQVYTVDYPQDPAVTDAEYNLLGEVTDEYGPGVYDLIAKIFLDDVQVYQRQSTFEIIKPEIVATTGLELYTRRDNTVNFDALADLPLINAEFDLPGNWTVKVPADPAADYVEYVLFDRTSGALIEIDITLRTNIPQFISYTEDQDREGILIFGLKDSTDIGNIHRAPSAFRVRGVYKTGGPNGEILKILQSDFGFRVPLEPGDYSGLRFISINQEDGFGVTVIDTDMPNSGRSYILPEYPELWSASARSFNGELFDEVKLEMSKDGIPLHSNALPDAVTIYTADAPITEIESDLLAYIVGTAGENGRTLNAPDGEDILIDDVGDYVVKATFTLAGVFVGVQESAFTITDGLPDDLPIVDFEEEDPTVPQWVKDITEAEVEKWNMDYVLTSDFDDLFDERYYTNLLTGYSVGLNVAVAAGDTMISAFGKLQAQINSKAGLAPGTVNYITKYLSSTTIGNSILSESGNVINLGAIDASPKSLVFRNSNTYWGLEIGTAVFSYAAESPAILVAHGGGSAPYNNFGKLLIVGRGVDGANGGISMHVGSDRGAAIDIQNDKKITIVNQLISTLTGVAPLSVANQLLNTNFNADLLDGKHAADFVLATDLPTSLAGYIRKSIADNVTAAHNFTGNGLSLPGNIFHSTLDGSNVYHHYSPSAGNSGVNTYAHLRVWNGSTGTSKELIIGGDGSLTWQGVNVALESRMIGTGTGLTGGRNLGADMELSVIYGSTSGTSAQGDDPRLSAGNLANLRWISFPTEGSGIANIIQGGVKAWNAGSTDAPTPYGTALTFFGASSTGNTEAGNWANQILAGTNSDWYIRYGSGNASSVSWSTTYQMWTSKQFSASQIASWNTAYSWGDHSGFGYATQAWVIGQDYVKAASYHTFTNKSGAISQWTNDVNYITAAALSGYATESWVNSQGFLKDASITYSLIVSKLGYTPYNASNPDNYISGINSGMITSALGFTPMANNKTIYINGITQNLNDNANFTVGTVRGTGSSGYLTQWASGGVNIENSIVRYTGSEININGSLGVEADSAFRADLHIHQNLRIGKSGYHGTLILHDLASAVIDPSAAFEVRSTTKGFLMPRMTYAQRMAISSPAVGLKVYQTDVGAGTSPIGEKLHIGSGVWTKNTVSLD